MDINKIFKKGSDSKAKKVEEDSLVGRSPGKQQPKNSSSRPSKGEICIVEAKGHAFSPKPKREGR